MFAIDGAYRLKIFPHEFAEFVIAQDAGRYFWTKEAGKFTVFLCPGAPPYAEVDIQQFPAIAADHGLHVAMPAAGRAATDLGAVMAERTFEKVRLAHTLE